MLIDEIMEDTSLWRAYNKKIDPKFAPNAGFAVLNLSYLPEHQYLSRSVPIPQLSKSEQRSGTTPVIF
jgi:hypothetical protein